MAIKRNYCKEFDREKLGEGHSLQRIVWKLVYRYEDYDEGVSEEEVIRKRIVIFIN